MGEEVESQENQAAPGVPVVLQVKLTPEERSAVTTHINQKAKDPQDSCPVCGDPNNIVLEDCYAVPVQTNVAGFGGHFQPLASTVCGNCGYVRFFNLLVVRKILSGEEVMESGGQDGS